MVLLCAKVETDKVKSNNGKINLSILYWLMALTCKKEKGDEFNFRHLVPSKLIFLFWLIHFFQMLETFDVHLFSNPCDLFQINLTEKAHQHKLFIPAYDHQ